MRTTRTLLIGLLALAAVTATAGAADKCRDDKGRFIKCPAAASASSAAHCRDKTTKKFAKCGLANSEPVPAAAGK